MQETVSLATAAQTLRVSWWSARELVLRGVLTGRLEDGRWRIERASLDAYRETVAA